MSSLIRDNLWAISAGALLLLLGVGGIIAAYQSPERKTDTKKYAESDAERPQMQLSENVFDLGAMRVDEIREKEVLVTNVGVRPLTLKRFTTSCDCTFAHMTIDGKESPHFTMHGMNNWTGTLEPGQSGTLTIIYEPAVMPVKGRVERAVLFETNDPANPRVTVSFTAAVQ